MAGCNDTGESVSPRQGPSLGRNSSTLDSMRTLFRASMSTPLQHQPKDSFPPDSEAAASRHSLLGLRRLSLPAAAVSGRLRSSTDGFPLRRLAASEEFPPSASRDTQPADNSSNTSTAMLSASAPTTAAAASAEAWRTFHRQSIRQALSQKEQIEHDSPDDSPHHLPHLHRNSSPLEPALKEQRAMQPPNVPPELASSGGSSGHSLHLDVKDHPAAFTGGASVRGAKGEGSRGGGGGGGCGCDDGRASGGDGGVDHASRSVPKQEDLDFFTQAYLVHASMD